MPATSRSDGPSAMAAMCSPSYGKRSRTVSKHGFRTTGIPITLAGAILAGATLTACAPPPDMLITCPLIRIPQNTERLTRFAPGDGRDITDVVLRAEVKFLSGECTIGEKKIVMTFPIVVRGLRGPAETDGTEPVDVFVAVTTRAKKPLSLRAWPLVLRFQGNRNVVVSSEVITVLIPKTAEQSNKDFLVYLGFRPSKEELSYNREESRG